MSGWPPLPPPPAVSASPNRSRKRLLFLLSLLAIVVLAILWSCGKGTYHSYRIASAAADHFHQQLNAADYDGIYEEASDDFRRSGTKADLTKFLESVHTRMGNSGKTSLAGFHVKWRNGRTWVNQVFNTQFALGEAQESFIWVKDQDVVRLYNYQIDAANLR